MTADAPQARRTDRWHFEKRLSLDTLVAVVSICAGLGVPIFYWGRAMEQRVQTLEIREETRAKQDTAREMDARDQRIAVLQSIDTMREQITQLRIDVGRVIVAAPAIRK